MRQELCNVLSSRMVSVFATESFMSFKIMSMKTISFVVTEAAEKHPPNIALRFTQIQIADFLRFETHLVRLSRLKIVNRSNQPRAF